MPILVPAQNGCARPLALCEMDDGSKVAFAHLEATLREVANGNGLNSPTGTERICAALALYKIEVAPEGTVMVGALRDLINKNAD